MARTLNTYVMVGSTIYEPGTSEADIDGDVTVEGVWSGTSDEGQKSYSSFKVDELKAEIARRNEGRDEADLIPLDGNKADLAAALELDDES